MKSQGLTLQKLFISLKLTIFFLQGSYKPTFWTSSPLHVLLQPLSPSNAIPISKAGAYHLLH